MEKSRTSLKTESIPRINILKILSNTDTGSLTALRIIVAFRTSPKTSLYCEGGLPTLIDFRHQQMIKYYSTRDKIIPI